MWASPPAQGMPHMHGSVQVSLHMSWECPGTCKHQEKRVDQRLQNCEGKDGTAMAIPALVDLTASSCMYRYACVDQVTIAHIYHAKSSQSPWKGRDSLLPLTPTLHFPYPPTVVSHNLTLLLSPSQPHSTTSFLPNTGGYILKQWQVYML